MTHIAFVHGAIANGDSKAQLNAKTQVKPTPRVIEAQHARMMEPGRGWVDIQSDAAGIQTRRILDRLMEKEHASALSVNIKAAAG
jgi:hypothetical protein